MLNIPNYLLSYLIQSYVTATPTQRHYLKLSYKVANTLHKDNTTIVMEKITAFVPGGGGNGRTMELARDILSICKHKQTSKVLTTYSPILHTNTPINSYFPGESGSARCP